MSDYFFMHAPQVLAHVSSRTMLVYRLLTDAILVLHEAFVLFLVLGLVLIVLGPALRWRWVRHFWFRVFHLAAIVIVVDQAWGGVPCPLTLLENTLRTKAGESTYAGGFIAHWYTTSCSGMPPRGCSQCVTPSSVVWHWSRL